MIKYKSKDQQREYRVYNVTPQIWCFCIKYKNKVMYPSTRTFTSKEEVIQYINEVYKETVVIE